MSYDNAIVAGHSHVFVLGFNSTSPGKPVGLERLPYPANGFFGFHSPEGPYEPSYWDELIKIAEDRTIFIMWLGSQHLAEFLFESEPPFDFLLAQAPTLSVCAGVQLVPETLVREYLSSRLQELTAVVDRLKALPDCRVVLVATPPPKGDHESLRSLMLEEEYYINHANHFGIELASVRLTAPFVLLKLWLTIQELLQEIATSKGVEYLPVPKGTLDENGFLRREFWESDVGHANRAYGTLLLNAASALLEHQKV